MGENSLLEDFEIPECYGQFICADDCMVSCPFWEECMHDNDQEDE